ncbi:putative defective in cullin neddylation protein 1 protein [Eutypa lata UCREL1]|uniref:Defective in cullin neddylation protein n=1 Tax=Eutypa lata (strain UCR-EL1) TaxID=1287681 RepID=M7SZQ3_EUTLA|nr:putative defective in cullin neddylation protein 1 protein [Eutypa lata UCREL1]
MVPFRFESDSSSYRITEGTALLKLQNLSRHPSTKPTMGSRATDFFGLRPSRMSVADGSSRRYFQGSGSGGQSKDAQLHKIFDDLRNPKEDDKDTLGADSTMKYLQKLGANLEDASFFIILEIVQAPSIGEITRSGFVEGWKSAAPVSGLETRGVDAKLEAQKQHFSRLLGTFSTDKDLFKKVYRSVFVFGKERDQRALNLDTAVTYWSLLFSAPGRRWISSTGEDLLAEWKAFLAENWTRSVNRDMWNMTLEFAYKTMEDGTLGFWSEDGAWPGVIDDFVAWYKASKDKDKATAVMDIDA